MDPGSPSDHSIQPYKFLDFYRTHDRKLFFGREREIETLVSDIVSARLVILFAKTGSGKSSLLNAGVRPRLEELDYETFWIRVEDDPIEAARAAFRNFNLPLDSPSFVENLKAIVAQLSKPIVLFFDQFEEFFLTHANPRQANGNYQRAADQFVSDVGNLYRDRQSGVHMVFSMREEFFHEMDVFRSEIPSIFSAESSLRLRWLDDTQARAAITQPALAAGVSFADELVLELINDLKGHQLADDGIEPARLQIVCDTLWTRKCFDLQCYQSLGRAKGILESRLEQDIDEGLGDAELEVFEKLLFELTHLREQTKRVRSLAEIETSLQVPPASLDALVEKLKTLRLIVKSKHSTGVFIEWTSDYLAGRAASLKDHVRGTRLRRLLHHVRAKAEEKVTELGDPTQARDLSTFKAGAEDEFETLYMALEDFEAISRDAHLLPDLAPADVGFLFRAALEHGTHLPLWFRKAAQAGVDPWEILRNRITQEDTQSAQSVSAVRLLGEVGAAADGAIEPKAQTLLTLALGQPDLANAALEAVAQIRSEGAVQLFAETIKREELAPKTIALLRQLKNSPAIRLLAQTAAALGPSALAAGTALARISTDSDFRSSREAREALTALLIERGAELFRLALETGVEMQSWLTRADEAGVPVWESLRELISDQTTSETVAQNIARLLPQVEDPRARDLSIMAKERSPKAQPRDIRRTPREPLSDSAWENVLRRISAGKCTPVIGPGASEDLLKLLAEATRRLAVECSYPFKDADNLSRVSQYLAVTQGDRSFAREEISNMWQKRQRDLDFFHPYRILARLPASVYVSTSFDTLLVEALRNESKEPRQVVCRWSRHFEQDAEQDRSFRPSVAAPLVFHLLGHVDQPESMVLSEDDMFDFLFNVSRDSDLISPFVQRALVSSMQLFVGVSPLSDVFRFLSRFTRDGALSHVLQMPESPERAESDYYSDYLGSLRVNPYFGTAEAFLTELHQRMESSYAS